MAINYMMQPINPGPSFSDTMQMVQGLNQMRDRKTAMQIAEQQAAAAQAQAAAQAEEQARLKEEFGAALKAAHENPTAENRLKLVDIHATYNPEKAKAFRENWNTYTEEKQKVILQDAASTLSALEADPQYGIKILQESADAAKNSGNMAEAKKYQALIDMVNIGPVGLQTAKDSLTMTVGMMPGGKEAIEGIAKFGEEKRAAAAEPTARKKALADLGLTNAQIDETIARTNKLNAEIKKMNDDLAVAKVSGGLDPEKKFNSELSLNKEYTTRTKSYDESLRLNDVIKTSAASGTGAGDLALINTFMKMLDPGSVVRESEFAQAQDTAGLVSKLAASLGRVKNGEVLVPAQRAEFAKLANEYMQAATKNEEKVRDGINFMVKSYGLNPENVFGTMANETTKKPNSEPDPATIQTAPSATVKQPTIKVDY